MAQQNLLDIGLDLSLMLKANITQRDENASQLSRQYSGYEPT